MSSVIGWYLLIFQSFSHTFCCSFFAVEFSVVPMYTHTHVMLTEKQNACVKYVQIVLMFIISCKIRVTFSALM